MNRPTNPSTIHKPLGMYVHSIETPQGSRWLTIAGQLGVDSDGVTAQGFRNQAKQVHRNILECLAANDMTPTDLVKLTIYSTVRECMDDLRAARREVMGENIRPTVTLVIVAGLAAPEFLVEIEAWAAKA